MECLPATSTPITLMLVALMLPVNLYPLFYAFRPWSSTPQGRALMVKAVSNAVLIDMGLATTVLGDYAGREAIRLVGFTLLVVGIWYLFVTLLRAPGAEDYPPRTWFRRR